MKSAGQILKESRIKQKKTLQDIVRKTKIPLSTLIELEKDNYKLLPPATFVKGFIRNYAQELNLDPKKVLAVYRRDNQPSGRKKILPRGVIRPLDKSFSWTPRETAILFSILIVILVGGFLFFQLRSYLFAPKLEIYSPQENVAINDFLFQIKGKTIPDATVFVNGNPADLELDGSFTYSLKLLAGENIIKIKAVSRRGKETEVIRKIIVDKE